MEATLNSINHFFEQFDDIYDNKDKYNISWAFKDAQNKLNGFKQEVVDKEMKNRCQLCKDKDESIYDIYQYCICHLYCYLLDQFLDAFRCQQITHEK